MRCLVAPVRRGVEMDGRPTSLPGQLQHLRYADTRTRPIGQTRVERGPMDHIQLSSQRNLQFKDATVYTLPGIYVHVQIRLGRIHQLQEYTAVPVEVMRENSGNNFTWIRSSS